MGEEIALVENIQGTPKKILEKTLSHGEPVHVFMEGNSGEYVAATDRRVLIIKSGFAAGGALGFGKKLKIFPYEHITSINCVEGHGFGRLQVSAAGTQERAGFHPTGVSLAENVVNFNAHSYEKFQAATNRIHELIDQYKDIQRIAASGPIPDQIKKLAELKDAGILTAEEFEQKKRQLLERM